MANPAPSEHRTVPDLLEAMVSAAPDKPFLVAPDGHVLTYRDFLSLVRRTARAMLHLGVERNDRIAIWAPNSAEWAVVTVAAQMIGAAMVPINTRFRGPEAHYVLERTRAKLLFTTRRFLGTDYVSLLESATRDAGPLPHLLGRIVLDETGRDGDVLGWPVFLDGQADDAALDRARSQVTPDTISDILFTSGTTGAPKGAMHDHAQIIWAVERWNRINDLKRNDRMAIVNPFFHSFGYRAGWFSALAAGMTAYPLATFDVAALAQLIERERITVLMGPPTLFNDLLSLPDRGDLDLSSLRVGHTGSSNVPVDLVLRASAELGYELFLTSYGLTEATALVTSCARGDGPETRATTVGRPVDGVELALLGDDGITSVGRGELLIRGPNVMRGYFEDPEATREAVDAAGWLHTGDVATIDDEGFVRIVDRLKDIIIVGGFNVYPIEIEKALIAHPAIGEIAIVGVPDERMGEVCAACVVLAPDAGLDLPGLTAWARERLANFKVPRHLLVLDSLPRTPLGKVQKFVLRDQAMARIGGSAVQAP